MNFLFYDIVTAAVLLLFVHLGRKKGFVLTLCGLMAMFVAFIGASVISNALCEPVANIFQPLIRDSIVQVLQQQLQQSAASLPQGELSLTIEEALSLLKESEMFQSFQQSLEQAVQTGVLDVVTDAASAIAGYIAKEIARLVIFVIAFVVVLLGWTLLSRVLDLAFRLPVLSTVNRLLGGLVGLFKGGLVVYIGLWLLRERLSPQVLSDTRLLKFFAENSPLTLFGLL